MLKLRSDCFLISQFNSNVQKQRSDSSLTFCLHVTVLHITYYMLAYYSSLVFCFLPSEVKPAY